MMSHTRVRQLGTLGITFIGVMVASFLSNETSPYFQDILRNIAIAIIMAVSLNIVNGLTGQFAIGHAAFMAGPQKGADGLIGCWWGNWPKCRIWRLCHSVGRSGRTGEFA